MDAPRILLLNLESPSPTPFFRYSVQELFMPSLNFQEKTYCSQNSMPAPFGCPELRRSPNNYPITKLSAEPKGSELQTRDSRFDENPHSRNSWAKEKLLNYNPKNKENFPSTTLFSGPSGPTSRGLRFSRMWASRDRSWRKTRHSRRSWVKI